MMNDLNAVVATPRLDVACLRDRLASKQEIAVLDVRECGEYGEEHLFLAVNVPYSLLEYETRRLVPRLSTPIVLCDDGCTSVAEKATGRLQAIGYTDVAVLNGGIEAWRAAGYTLFAGVNLPSKTFGELVEHFYATPHVSPEDLARKLTAGENLVVVDGRPFHEYQKMNIPGAISCPNGELALRISAIVPDPDTTIVMNCAGRTRGIIGAQTLIDLGLPNPIFALKNGTQGWMLADLQLEHGASRRYPVGNGAAHLEESRQRVQTIVAGEGIPIIDSTQLAQFYADAERTTYLCDVRTPEEFAASSFPGARSTPGGQLMQATDQYIGTRGARLVLVDGEQVRAPIIASWMRKMGWETYVLAASAHPPQPVDVQIDLPDLPVVDAALLARWLPDRLIMDLRSSTVFRRGHLQGAIWSIRPRLASASTNQGKVVLVVDDPRVARIAALDLRELGITDISMHVADTDAWQEAGLAMEVTPNIPSDADSIDYLFFVHDRHEGNKEAARRYLKWETDLVSRMDGLERSIYRLPNNE